MSGHGGGGRGPINWIKRTLFGFANMHEAKETFFGLSRWQGATPWAIGNKAISNQWTRSQLALMERQRAALKHDPHMKTLETAFSRRPSLMEFFNMDRDALLRAHRNISTHLYRLEKGEDIKFSVKDVGELNSIRGSLETILWGLNTRDTLIHKRLQLLGDHGDAGRKFVTNVKDFERHMDEIARNFSDPTRKSRMKKIIDEAQNPPPAPPK